MDTKILTTDNIDVLVKKVLTLYGSKTSPRIIISIAGAPGSGKSTVALELCNKINKILPGKSVIVSQDGFHYSREKLKKFEDPDYALKRRGAPFTFDAASLVNMVKSLNETQKVFPILVPTFDHSKKDPIDGELAVTKEHEIILLEGNYLHLEEAPWNEISPLCIERWFVQCPLSEIKKRIIRRHMKSGICDSFSEAEDQVKTNDLLNAEYVIKNSISPNLIFNN